MDTSSCLIYYFTLYVISTTFNKVNCALKDDGEKLSEVCKDGDNNNLEECEDVETLNEWANNLPILKNQDNNIVNFMRSLVHQQETDPMLTDDAVIDHFQLIMALPLQTACHVGKFVALKRWHSNCGSTDGEQYLCMDNFFRDIEDEKCLIYSFGIADNYDFEKQMG